MSMLSLCKSSALNYTIGELIDARAALADLTPRQCGSYSSSLCRHMVCTYAPGAACKEATSDFPEAGKLEISKGH